MERTFRSRTNPLRETPTELMETKSTLRRAAYDARNAQKNKDKASAAAVAALVQLPEYQAAKTALWYLDCRSELRTRHAIPSALESGKKIVVPYCTVDDVGANKLGLWWLRSMDELVVGKWNILEPPRDRWGEPERVVDVEQLDIVIVPGRGLQSRRRPNGKRPGLLRPAARSRTTRLSAGCALLREPVVRQSDRRPARRLHGQGCHRTGGVRWPGPIAGPAKRYVNYRIADARRYR